MSEIHVIDSHTGGEPTRIVTAGGPELGRGTVQERLQVFRKSHDRFRSAIVNEPRGSDVLVGGLLIEPSDSTCAAGIIYFNNVGYLGMCGHDQRARKTIVFDKARHELRGADGQSQLR